MCSCDVPHLGFNRASMTSSSCAEKIINDLSTEPTPRDASERVLNKPVGLSQLCTCSSAEIRADQKTHPKLISSVNSRHKYLG